MMSDVGCRKTRVVSGWRQRLSKNVRKSAESQKKQQIPQVYAQFLRTAGTGEQQGLVPVSYKTKGKYEEIRHYHRIGLAIAGVQRVNDV